MKASNFEKDIAIIAYIYKHSSYDEKVTSTEIKEYMKKKFKCNIDKRTIESTIESFNHIREGEYEITIEKGNPNKYFFSLTSGFDLGEIKAIYDLIYSSHYFTEKTKDNILLKLKELFNIKDGEILNKNVDTHVCRNEDSRSFYTSYETIAKAIYNRQKISFDYIKPQLGKHDKPKRNNNCCPIEIFCENNNYYLYCYYEDKGKNKISKSFTYRIDFIFNVTISNEIFENNEAKKEEVREGIIKSTAAYLGRDSTIEILFHEDFYPNIRDKFGNEIKRNIRQHDMENYIVTVPNCSISATFYGWLVGFNTLSKEGNNKVLKIIGPDDEISKFIEFNCSLISNSLSQEQIELLKEQYINELKEKYKVY